MDILFYAIAIAIVILVVVLNCLQGAPGSRLFGFIQQCNYGLSSQDFQIKAGAITLFVLFLALLFGPVLGVIKSHGHIKGSRRTKMSSSRWLVVVVSLG
jgi:hypothetical protein